MDILGIKGRAYTMYSRSKRITTHLKQTCLPLVCSALLGLSACSGSGNVLDPEKYDFHDRKQELSRDDYRDMMRPEGTKQGKDFRPYFEGEQSRRQSWELRRFPK